VQYDNDEDVRNDRGQFVSQIWAVDGSLVFSSLDEAGPPRQEPGLHVLDWQGTEWRAFSLREGGLTIQVATTSASRARRFASIAPWLLLPLVVLVIVLGLLIHAAVARALAPLEHVRSEIGQRGVTSLHGLDTDGMPDEVAPLVLTLNDLLARLDTAMVAQRRFIAEAAHELRSPLTAVKLQAQIAGRSHVEGDRQFALAQLSDGIDRASHLIEQLLDMARLEPSAGQAAFEPVALDALVKQVTANFSPQADARDIDLGVGACEPLTLHSQADNLRMLLGNLIDNAVRYTPTGGRIDVELRRVEGNAVISVSDSGPGIPESEHERVFERFHRLAGSETPGSGLGLAIVRQVASLLGGQVELGTSPVGGLAVRVIVPLR
jgi:signal transduction histidine kinase